MGHLGGLTAIVAAKLLLLGSLLPDPLKRLGFARRLILRLGLRRLRVVCNQLQVLLLQLLLGQRIAGVVKRVPVDRLEIILYIALKQRPGSSYRELRRKRFADYARHDGQSRTGKHFSLGLL